MKENQLDKLKEGTMIEHYLAWNMRNSKEIHELVEATKEVLKEKQIVFIDSKDSKIGDESEERKESNTSNESEKKQESKENSEKNSIFQEEIPNHEDHQEDETETICGIEADSLENHSNSKMGNRAVNSLWRNSLSDELEVEPKREIRGQSVENSSNTKMRLDGAKAEVEHKSKGQSVKDHGDSVMGLDEAQAIIGSSMGNDTGGNSTQSDFAHEVVDNIGHKIKTERPLLFELGHKEEFQKRLSLVTIFMKLLNTGNKHVVLHFNTEPNAIPSTLQFVFDHHFDNKMETTNFKEFESNKRVLVCSYPTFRGLEYPRITVLIDCDIYFQQHYLVEMLARCTSKLSVVISENSPALTNVIEKWKTEELVNQWKIEISKKKNQTDNSKICWDDELKIIKGTIKSKYYEDLAKKCESSSNIKETTLSIRLHKAREIIDKQR